MKMEDLKARLRKMGFEEDPVRYGDVLPEGVVRSTSIMDFVDVDMSSRTVLLKAGMAYYTKEGNRYAKRNINENTRYSECMKGKEIWIRK